MKTNRRILVLATAMGAALALSACGKSDQSASPVPSTPPPSATAMAPPMTPPPSSMPGMQADSAADLTFSSVELGSSVDASNMIRASGTSFAPSDNIYAAVQTVGTGNATLAAKWTYQDGQTVHEDSKTLDTMGPQTTAFMISKPDGFPAGDYKVEISLDGQPVASKDFSVKK